MRINSMSPLPVVFLDIETTGFSASDDEIIEIAIIGNDGRVLFESLCRPVRKIISGAITRITGITNKMVANAPTLAEIWPRLQILLAGKRVVIYNKAFDRRFFPDDLDCAGDIVCAMHAWRLHVSEQGLRSGYKLADAAAAVGYIWTGDSHRARADAMATRAVWNFVNSPVSQVHQPSLFDLAFA